MSCWARARGACELAVRALMRPAAGAGGFLRGDARVRPAAARGRVRPAAGEGGRPLGSGYPGGCAERLKGFRCAW